MELLVFKNKSSENFKLEKNPFEGDIGKGRKFLISKSEKNMR